MKVLVVGGAGYVGSHTCLALYNAGHEVSVFDDLSTGHRWAAQWGELIVGSLMDAAAIESALASVRPDVVVHFAARSLVGESMVDPYLYYEANVGGTLNLLMAMRRQPIERIVFSSTAAIFGDPVTTPMAEDHPTAPINPYGRSKLMIEWMLADAARSYGLRSVALRYFNAAGADPDGRIGEDHEPETHLIPRLLGVAAGKSLPVGIFGNRHPTPDGTCIRDYVHVLDLADAHLLAIERTADKGAGFETFNLGTGVGHSVHEVLQMVRQVTGQKLDIPTLPERAGDPAVLVASSARAKAILGWNPCRTSLQRIVEDAWTWHRRSPPSGAN